MFNPKFNMAAETQIDLENLLKIVFKDNQKIVGYAIRGAEEGQRWDEDLLKDPRDRNLLGWREKPKPVRIVFFWTTPNTSDYVPLPFSMDAKGCADFAMRWLGEVHYGIEPDTDGSVIKGWACYNHDSQSYDSEWEILFGISPTWIVCGK